MFAGLDELFDTFSLLLSVSLVSDANVDVVEIMIDYLGTDCAPLSSQLCL